MLLTIVEGKTPYSIIKAIAKSAPTVTNVLNRISNLFCEQFSQLFKSITSDNGSEFTNLSTIETEAEYSPKKIYFNYT